jgi:hypothetical protein
MTKLAIMVAAAALLCGLPVSVDWSHKEGSVLFFGQRSGAGGAPCDPWQSLDLWMIQATGPSVLRPSVYRTMIRIASQTGFWNYTCKSWEIIALTKTTKKKTTMGTKKPLSWVRRLVGSKWSEHDHRESEPK